MGTRGARRPKTTFVWNGQRYVEENLNEQKLRRQRERLISDLRKNGETDEKFLKWVEDFCARRVGRDPIPKPNWENGPVVSQWKTSAWGEWRRMGQGLSVSRVRTEDPRRDAAADAAFLELNPKGYDS